MCLCRSGESFNRVPRGELWYCMKKSGVAEKYIKAIQDMYKDCKTVVRCAIGATEVFKVDVGRHQVLALRPFLFAMVMDRLTDEVRLEFQWTTMFADDIVICGESREQLEGKVGLRQLSEKGHVRSVNSPEQWRVWKTGEEVCTGRLERMEKGVMCDRRGSTKGKMYKTVVRPAMLVGLQTVPLRRRQTEWEVADMKMLRFSLEVTRMDQE